jgi:hypothetical protein
MTTTTVDCQAAAGQQSHLAAGVEEDGAVLHHDVEEVQPVHISQVLHKFVAVAAVEL